MRVVLAKLTRRLASALPHSRLKRFIILAGIIFLIFTYFSGDFGFIRMMRLKQKKKNLELQFKKLQAEVLQLEREKNLLQSDPYYLEKIAREKYGLSRPDE